MDLDPHFLLGKSRCQLSLKQPLNSTAGEVVSPAIVVNTQLQESEIGGGSSLEVGEGWREALPE